MAEEQLMGMSLDPTTNYPKDYKSGQRFQCVKSGILTTIKVFCRANSNVKVALYKDAAGPVPYELLAYSASTALTSGAYRSISLVSSYAVTKDTYYWILATCGTAGGMGYKPDGLYSARYKADAYANAWPDPITGTTLDPTAIFIGLQGWGETSLFRPQVILL